MSGLAGDRRFGSAISEERGEKEHVVCEHGLPTVPWVRNLGRKNELLGSRGRVTLKTKQLEITVSNKSAVGPNQHEERRVLNCQYVWVLCDNVTQKGKEEIKKNRAACNAVFSYGVFV